MIGFLRRFRAGEKPLGAQGEDAAARYLKRLGYRILERNREVGRDEADIVALDPDERTIVVVEVKTRRDGGILPQEQVGPVKQHHLSRIAARLQRDRRYLDRPFRFDVVAITSHPARKPEIVHIRGAFDSTI